MLAHEHGAIDAIRRWPQSRDLLFDTRTASDHQITGLIARGVANHRFVLAYVPERPPVLPVKATPAVKAPVAKPPPGVAPTAAQQANAAVAAMSPVERIIAALQRSARFMGPELATAFAQVFTLRNLEIFAALMLASAAANTNPVTGAVFDSAMLLFVYYQAGSVGVHALGLLLSTTIDAIRAGTEAQLDEAGKNYAHAFVGLGGAIFMAWLARRMVAEKGGGDVEARSTPPSEPAPAARTVEPAAAARPGSSFADNAKLQDHWQRHGTDFGATSAREYQSQASDFLTGPKPAGVLEKLRANGDLVRFDPATDEFGILSPTNIRTYFAPDPLVHGLPTNLDYFNAQ